MKLRTFHIVLIAILCSILLGVTIWAIYAEYDRPWKQYQYGFRKLKQDTQEETDIKVEQIWVKELNIVDRCITCHQGADDPKFFNAAQPYKTHFGAYLKYHPVKKFGCVLCHEGKGEALTVKAAHGEVNDRDKPILRGTLAQASCAKCHGLPQKLPLSAEIPAATVYTKGWRLFNEYNCTGCHRLSNYERPTRIAPTLSSIGSKVNKDWLMQWLTKPTDYLPNTKMPTYKLSDDEVGYIAEYLMSLKSDNSCRGTACRTPIKVDNEDLLIKDGNALLTDLSCLGCHKLNDRGVEFGPDFTNIGHKVKADWLYQFLKDPRSYDPKTIIPDFNITETNIPVLVNYVMSLKKNINQYPHPDSPTSRRRENTELPDVNAMKLNSINIPSPGGRGQGGGGIEKGKKLVKDLGCAGCHDVDGIKFRYNAPDLDGIGDKRKEQLAFGGVKNVEKNLFNWLRIKIADPGRFADSRIITRMPGFDFNDEEVDALVTFLSGLRKTSIPLKYKKELADKISARSRGKSIIEKYNCNGCHRINNKGGSIGPDLSMEAKKSRTEWLFSFLKSPVKIRPEYILKARMPDFNLSDTEVNTIIEYLSTSADEPYPFTANIRHEIYMDDIRNGEKLYHEIFACIGCHQVQGNGGGIGPDHTDLSSRLKRDWIKLWLTDPQAIKSDVRMPRFSFKDWEFEALSNYLSTLGRFRFVDVKKD